MAEQASAGAAERGADPGAAHRRTDNLPVLNQVALPAAPQAGMAPPQAAPITHDYGGLNTPSVWRSGRTAAAKVDAAHGVFQLVVGVREGLLLRDVVTQHFQQLLIQHHDQSGAKN